jgi:hypothetical protein
MIFGLKGLRRTTDHMSGDLTLLRHERVQGRASEKLIISIGYEYVGEIGCRT